MKFVTINKVAIVDVDITLVDSPSKWMEFLQANCSHIYYNKMCNDNPLEYDLSKYFEMKVGVDPFDFWRQYNLYDDLSCDMEASNAIYNLYKDGWKILFMSYCFEDGSHATSKIKMLKYEFPFISEEDFHFINTKNKGLYSPIADVIVDDRNEFLNQMDGSVTCFKINSPYTQDYSLTRDVILVDSWEEIYDKLKEE